MIKNDKGDGWDEVEEPGEPAQWWLAGLIAAFAAGTVMVVLWGILPQVALLQANVAVKAVGLVVLDCAVMPLLGASVHLGPDWLLGEAVAVALVLVPGLLLGHWTRTGTHLRWRAAMQVAAAGLVFLYLLPEVIFAVRPGRGWDNLLLTAGWAKQMWVQGILLLAVPGLAAVMEFVERGGGTPIPYDPPVRLVTSGIYRYCANPMQLSCAVVMVAWAGWLRSGWMLVAAGLSVVYSAGIAEWDEREDLRARFEERWVAYRAGVPRWWFRWSPYEDGAVARAYMARTCGPCDEVRGWLERRRPVGLEFVEAETLPQGSIERMRYEVGGTTVEGVRAMGRVLEHLHLGWAMCGFTLRLPGVWWVVQLVMDGSGFGPRRIRAVTMKA